MSSLFLDPGRTSIIPKWVLEKEINQYVGNSKYKKWVPDWFKNLEMSQLIPRARPWIQNATFRGVGVPVTSSPPIERINTLNKVRRATGLPAISINE